MNYRILLLSLGVFAVGTEGLMIAGILPTIANQFHVTLTTAGLLVTFFSLIYAIGSPVLTTMLGHLERRRLLILSLLIFTVGNLICGMANSYELMLIGRVVGAIGAGLFAPAATAIAASLVSPEKRGRALSIVLGGQTVAMIVGVPLGTWLALTFQWRMPFWIVAATSIIAAILIRLLFPSIPSSEIVSMKDRIAFMKRPEILFALFTTLLWSTGIFSVYTYLAEIFIGLGAAEKTISLVLLIAGIGNFIGVSLGGYSVDKFGSSRTIKSSLPVLVIALAAFSFLGYNPHFSGVVEIGIAVGALWGISTYMFNPAQQYHIMTLSGPSTGIALSLNSSAVYLGSALGAILGGLVIKYGSAADIGYVGGGCVLIALLLFWISARVVSAKQQHMEVSK